MSPQPPYRILLVEDDKLLWTFLQTQLANAGYSVTVCTDGQKAIESLAQESYDLILLDLVLPGKDGYTIIKDKKDTLNAATPVFVVTNLRSKEHMDRALELGAKRFYPKAMISITALIDDIATLLGNTGAAPAAPAAPQA